MFALNFGIIYLFEFLVLVEVVRHLHVVHQNNKMYENNMFINTFVQEYS